MAATPQLKDCQRHAALFSSALFFHIGHPCYGCDDVLIYVKRTRMYVHESVGTCISIL